MTIPSSNKFPAVYRKGMPSAVYINDICENICVAPDLFIDDLRISFALHDSAHDFHILHMNVEHSAVWHLSATGNVMFFLEGYFIRLRDEVVLTAHVLISLDLLSIFNLIEVLAFQCC